MNDLGVTHLSFRWRTSTASTAAIVAAGGTLVEQTRTVLGEATDSAAPRFIYLTDPDGTRIELMQNVPDLSAMG
jgi:lactoylglutathione lyase